MNCSARPKTMGMNRLYRGCLVARHSRSTTRWTSRPKSFRRSSMQPSTSHFRGERVEDLALRRFAKLVYSRNYPPLCRNLNLWGFESISEGPHKGGSLHPLFVKGNPDQCHYMTRHKIKVTNTTKRGVGGAGASPSSTSIPTAINANVVQGQHRSLGNGTRNDLLLAALALSHHRPDSSFALPSLLQPHVSTRNGVLGSTSDSSSSNCAAATSMANVGSMPLPAKLHHMCTRDEFNKDCVSWTRDKRCIKILNPLKFQQVVLPVYFGHASYAVFNNELEDFGFSKISREGASECFYHDVSSSTKDFD
jgi:hypothetical protein